MKFALKNWILFLATILLLSACVQSQENFAERVSEIPLDEEQLPAATSTGEEITLETVPFPALTKIEMIDAENGWGQAEGMILRTEDGGESWLDVTPEKAYNDPAYAESVFLDEKTGWVLIEDIDSPTVGTIFRTTDGGLNWRWRNTPFGRSDIGFLDSDNGYGLTDLGAAAGSMGVSIWQTINGGGDYNRVFLHEPGFDDSLPFNGIKNGISFFDPENGWVGGSTPQDGFIWLYRTRDGGFSWELQDLPMPASYELAQASVDAPFFFDSGQGLLPVHLRAEESATVFYRTIDGGETWFAASPVAVRGKYTIISAKEIILWDGASSVYSTLDGGENWVSSTPNWNPSDTLRELDFVSAMRGWALSEKGLYRTDDGGASWEKLGE